MSGCSVKTKKRTHDNDRALRQNQEFQFRWRQYHIQVQSDQGDQGIQRHAGDYIQG